MKFEKIFSVNANKIHLASNTWYGLPVYFFLVMECTSWIDLLMESLFAGLFRTQIYVQENLSCVFPVNYPELSTCPPCISRLYMRHCITVDPSITYFIVGTCWVCCHCPIHPHSPEGYELWHPRNWSYTTTKHLPPHSVNYLGHQTV